MLGVQALLAQVSDIAHQSVILQVRVCWQRVGQNAPCPGHSCPAFHVPVRAGRPAAGVSVVGVQHPAQPPDQDNRADAHDRQQERSNYPCRRVRSHHRCDSSGEPGSRMLTGYLQCSGACHGGLTDHQ